MTAPMWMAFPPEVHSGLLGSGPGPGGLLSAAGAWNSLSEEYASVAQELTALLGAVQAGAWEGPTAETYAAANAPYIAWLLQNSANSVAMAAQHETAATAYTAALAAMPTLAELAANHAVHAVLVSTNFFGINTIPIALNEADYVRMWVQAAATMTTYQAVSTAAVAAAPQTDPAPRIVKADATSNSTSDAYPTPAQTNEMTWFDQLLQQFLGYTHTGTLPAPKNPLTAPYPSQTNAQAWASILANWNTYIANGGQLTPGQPLSYDLGNALFFINYTFTDLLPGDVAEILHGNISQIFSLETLAIAFSFISMRISNIFEITNVVLNLPLAAVGIAPVSFPAPVLALADLAAAAAPLGAVGAFPGLAGLASVAGVPSAVAPVAIAPVGPIAAPAAAPAAPVPASVAAPAPGVPQPPAAPPPPLTGTGTGMGMGMGMGTGMSADTVTGMEGFNYLVGGMPVALRSSTRAKAEAPASDKAATPVAAAATATREPPPVRRRRRAKLKQLGRRYEYLDLEPELESVPNGSGDSEERRVSVAASDRGAGPLGFAGTVSKGGAQATGLTTLSSDQFGGGPAMPMLPGTWDPEAPGGEGEIN
jgi:PPE-repeat protein